MLPTDHTDTQGSPDSISAELGALLRSAGFPCAPTALADTARSEGAANEVVARLAGLPERDYHDADDVMRALGETHS